MLSLSELWGNEDYGTITTPKKMFAFIAKKYEYRITEAFQELNNTLLRLHQEQSKLLQSHYLRENTLASEGKKQIAGPTQRVNLHL